MAEPLPDVPLEVLLSHRAWVRQVARALAGSGADADDLEQEAWLRALGARPRDAGAVRAWFRTVLRRLTQDGQRSAARRDRRERESARPEGTRPTVDVVTDAEAHRVVVNAVMALDEPFRSIVLLRHFEGLTLPEIAARQGVPLETARTRLRRAHARLRARLAKRGGDDGLLVLVPLLRADGPVPAAATTGAGGVCVTTGAILMGTKTKAAIVAALCIAAAGTVWHAVGGGHGESAPRAEVAEAPDGPAVRRTAPDSRRAERDREVPSAPALPDRAPEESVAFAVHGRIVDAVTAEPVAGARVSVGNEFARIPEDEPSAVSGGDGRFRIEGLADEGFAHAFVTAEGYCERVVARLPWRGRAADAEAGDLGDVELWRGERVTGRVVDPLGTLVPGARLHLLGTHSFSAFWVNYAAVYGRAGPDGRFTLEHVPPSERSPYVLIAVAESGALGWAELPASAGRDPVDAVEVRLRPIGSAVVRVVDAEGRPIAGARVLASPRFEPLGPPTHVAADRTPSLVPDRGFDRTFAAETDGAGVARLNALPVGGPRYDFVARAKGLGFRERVTVRAGETSEVEIVVEAPRTWAIAGHVEDADGMPVAGAVVVPAWGPGEVTTPQDGTFRLEGLESGWDLFRFEVRAPGRVRTMYSASPPAGAAETRVTVVLEEAVAVSGKVVDQHGNPVEGASVALFRSGSASAPSSATTAADGTFEITDATAGTWHIRPFPPEPFDAWVAPYPMRSVHGGDRDVVVVLERTEPGIARLVAEVVDARTGAALAPREAMLIPSGPGSGTRVARAPAEIAAGGVTFERVGPGAWRVWVRVPDRTAAWTDVTVEAGATEAAARVAVADGGTLRGRIVLPPGVDERPVMVFVERTDVRSTPQWATYRTDRTVGAEVVAEDGTFVFRGLVPGEFRVFVQEGGLAGEARCEVVSATETGVVLDLAPAAVVAFRLARPSPARVVVFDLSRDGEPWRTVKRLGGQEGRVSEYSKTLPPGPWRWRVSFPGGDDGGMWRSPEAAQAAEGRLSAVAGETTVVEVPVD